jgi:hypothetical protein
MLERYFKGEKHIKPNDITINSVLDAWANSSDERASERYKHILGKMEDLCQLSGDLDLQPNVQIHSTVLNAWAKSSLSSSATQTEKILREMER